MITGQRLATTRLDLLRARRDLGRVRRGAALVRRKREALVAELFRAARPALDVRDRIVRSVTDATTALLDAIATHGDGGLRAMSLPQRTIALELRSATVWGIPVADVTKQEPLPRTLDARGTHPALTGVSAAEAASRFERLAELLIEAAPREQRVRRLGDAVSRTTRQMRTLEQRVAPTLEAQITRVRRQLDERDREDRLRLKRLSSRLTGSDQTFR
jgi:V/A-type H+-transporting ATPase subunit D